MRHLIIGMMIFTMFFVAPKMTVAGDSERFCEMMAKTAGAIMQKRQANVEMSRVMAVLPEGDDIRDTVEAMVIDAYNSPAYSTEEYKRKAVREFKNEVYLKCYKAFCQ